ncbi:MAG TPA: hypothetical protein VLH35_02925 [Candidatus Acidoferrales bacterium]|nr:hypothetical protein [Candidatus Acidoferrales bacterium]
MESTVAALLLLTSTVIIACVVVTYAVDIVSSFINTADYPQIGQLRELQENILNQTSNLYSNQTAAIPTG